MPDAAPPPRPWPLTGLVQPYRWGDVRFIPELQGRAPRDGAPEAELWLGAHPDGSATAEVDGVPVPLDALLGPGRELPFLLKILAAAQPLSIQVHPDTDAARRGFAGDPRGRFRDPSGKPELIVALTDFDALIGFRPAAERDAVLRARPELADLAGRDLEPLVADWLRAPQDAVDARLDPLLRRLARGAEHPLDRLVAAADARHSGADHRDRGLLFPYLMHVVRLRPGQGLFLAPGLLHAYLGGAGVEVMGNSNNVFRAGLTDKPVDPEGVLATVRFRTGPPRVLEPDDAGRYATPGAPFVLRRLRIDADATASLGDAGPRVLVVTEAAGTVRVAGAGVGCALPRGGAAFVPAGVAATLAADGAATVFVAAAPD